MILAQIPFLGLFFFRLPRKGTIVLLDELTVLRGHLIRTGEKESIFADAFQLPAKPVLELLELFEEGALKLVESQGIEINLVLIERLHAFDDTLKVGNLEILTLKLTPQVIGFVHPLTKLTPPLP
jgi:hypothetical protein